MPDEYNALVTDLKALQQGEEPNTVTLPMAEDDWNTRPDSESYGTVRLDFEADALRGDDVKVAEAFEGSVDLFSKSRSGGGWIPLIKAALTKHCGGCWNLNTHMYERDTGLFHWEWAFQIGD